MLRLLQTFVFNINYIVAETRTVNAPKIANYKRSSLTANGKRFRAFNNCIRNSLPNALEIPETVPKKTNRINMMFHKQNKSLDYNSNCVSNSICGISEHTITTRYKQSLDELISDCKEAEILIKNYQPNGTEKSKCDKESKSFAWAISEYLSDINSNDWKSNKGIDYLLNIKDFNKSNKRTIFNPDLVRKIKGNMDKRTLTVSIFGKPKIWRPSRYIPPKRIVLANTMEELNNLYKIDDKK